VSEAWQGFVDGGRSRLDLVQDVDRYFFHIDDKDRTIMAVATTTYPTRIVYGSATDKNPAVFDGTARCSERNRVVVVARCC
jgi:hypothetical protein